MRKLKNEELDRLSVEEYKEAKKSPIIIVLDNVRSMNNVGSAFRTGDAFRVEKIILTGITAKPPHREIHKTALGATESVTWEYFEDTLQAIKHLKDEGYKILAIEQADESVLLNQFKPDKNDKYAVVFGHEINGVSEKVVKAANTCLEIPQIGSKHSLNISVSIGISLWDISQKLRLV
ncbi:MAG: RNA methyltransferase [Bacteroidota bacterium]